MDCSPPGSSVHGILQARILEPCCHFLLQGIFLTWELNLGLLHYRQILYQLSYKGSPISNIKGSQIFSQSSPNLPFPQVSIHISNSLLNTISFTSNITQQGFLGGSEIENLPANAGDTGSIPGLGRSHTRSN